jgi:signal transduction histidine kinase
MGTPLRVLLVEDSADDAALIVRALQSAGYAPSYERVDTPEAMSAVLASRDWDVVLSDHSMPRFSAHAALELVLQQGQDVPFIIVSGSIGEDIAVGAMRMGVHDYLIKGNLARLAPAIARELREAEVRRERRRLEDLLRQAQKLESIGRLAGGVAHDFNNMLTAILGFVTLAQQECELNPTATEYLRQVTQSAERAANLTSQLMTFARRQIIKPMSLNLNDLIVDLDPMLGRLITESIALEIVPSEGLHAVKVDPTQFEQILINLVVNARDAMPNGGRITIETQNTTLTEECARYHPEIAPGDYIVLSVSDTGCGMDESIRLHIFEPFFTTKEEGRGTGLGLATVYGIVKQAGGHITLRSAPGEGSTFQIYLPRTTEEVQAMPMDAGCIAGGGCETVLLVEDDPAVRTLAVHKLRRLGYTVLEASNGEDALSMARGREREIDLLFTDVVMPKMNGKELSERLLCLNPDLKVLFASGYAGNIISHHGVLETGIAFLTKPFTLAQLTSKVREVLDA